MTSGHDTVTASVFRDCDGQIGVRQDYAGCRPTLKLQNAGVGQVPELLFELDPAAWRTSTASLQSLNLTPNRGPAHAAPLCLGAVVTLGSYRQIVDTQNLEIDFGLEVAKRKSMIPLSGVRASRYSKRAVAGKYDLDLIDDSQYAEWRAQPRHPLVIQLGDAVQTIAIIVPYAVMTNVEAKDTDGIQTQDRSFMADRTDTIGPVVVAFFPGLE